MRKADMNPNSANQVWSKWTFRVEATRVPAPSFALVRENCARFGRKAFGSATQMRITHEARGRWLIDVRTEGVPVHDPAFVTFMYENWRRFFRNGFGGAATVTCTSKLEA